MISKSGVYKIVNLINNKMYIGSTEAFKKRFSTHKRQLSKNIHNNIHLQRAWNKYGADNFEFSILETCSKEDNIKLEQWFLDTLKPEYNILKVAGSLKGFIHSQESRDKVRKASTGRVCSEETRKKLSLAHKGIPKPKVTLSQKGRKMSKEQKKLLSKLATGRKRGEIESTFKPVLMLNIDTNIVIQEFKSLKHALIFLNKKQSSKSCISRCAKGIYKTYMGYKWEFKNKHDK